MQSIHKINIKACALLALWGMIFGNAVHAQVFDMVVAADGSGDYTSIQAAIDAVPANQAQRTLIFVKGGMYREKVTTTSSVKNVSIIGEDAEKVTLSWNDYSPSTSAADSYTLLADIAGLYVENLTIENTAYKEFSGVGQALAVRTIGDSMAFKNCKYMSFQDTYYAHKNRNYNLNCYVEGGTDFIYGDATSVWDSCTIKCLKGGSFITAPADAKIVTPIGDGFLHGLLFRYCTVTAEIGVPDNQYYLGRPWNEKSSSVYIECTLGPHIRPAGWSTWEGNNHESSVFAEYKSMTPQGELVDVSKRVDWSYQLDSATVAKRYNLGFFLRRFRFPNHDTWDPTRVTTALSQPTGFKRNGSVLVWQKVENAIGYVVLQDGAVIGFSETESFDLQDALNEASEYTAKSVSFSGALSGPATDTPVSSAKVYPAKLHMTQSRNQLHFSERADYRVYDLKGQLVLTGTNTTISTQSLKGGVYVVKAISAKGTITQKIKLY